MTLSVWFVDIFDRNGPTETRNLMMWTGHPPTSKDILRARKYSRYTHWGDAREFDRKLKEYRTENPDEDEPEVKVYNDLEPDQRFFGEFHWYQLITNGFLHDGILHIAGNLLFLFVFGSRVNALIGQWRTAVLYAVLLVIASASELLSMMLRVIGRPSPVPALRVVK